MSKLTTTKDSLGRLKLTLEHFNADIIRAVGEKIAPRIASVALNAVRRNPGLLDGGAENLASFMGAMLTCADLQLLPDGQQGALISYKNSKSGVLEVQFQPMFKGLLRLAWRSDQIAAIETSCWHELDKFDYVRGSGARLDHRPHLPSRDHGGTMGAYACVHVKGSDRAMIEVMDVDEIERNHMSKSRSAHHASSPWKTAFDAMCMKTVLKKISKRLPASEQLQRAIELDERAEIGAPQHIDHVELPVELGSDFDPRIEDLILGMEQSYDMEESKKLLACAPDNERVQNAFEARVEKGYSE